MKHAELPEVAYPVIRITLSYLHELAEALGRLEGVTAGRFSDQSFAIFGGKIQIEGFLNQSVFSSAIRSSRQAGESVLEAIDRIVEKHGNDDNLSDIFVVNLRYNVAQFKTALLAELNVLPAYLVSQKEGFDTLTLLDNGFRLFPADLPSKVPEAVFDAQEVGKAIAFELGTSAGFHTFRILECVLRRFHKEVTGGAAPPKVRSITIYAKALRASGNCDEKIISVLGQIASLHRNPLIHPEVVLTMDEACSILGIARSAIIFMLSEMPVVPPTTTVAASHI